jgi:hypothetical protein
MMAHRRRLLNEKESLMRSRWRSTVAVLALPVVFSGCAFNLACEVFGSFYQGRMPGTDVCGAFNGECCGDEDGDGLPDECSGFLGFSPCDRFDTTQCFCTTSGEFVGVGQTLLPPAPSAYALPPNAFFDLRLPFPGLSSAHRVFFDVVADTLQTFRATLNYPEEFGFNGFLALGPPETQVGAYGVDFDGDFVIDLSLPLRALTADTAYVDGNGNRRADAADATLQHTTNGAHVFTTTIPRGGDGLARVKLGRVAMRAAVALYPGLLINPTSPYSYPVSATFTSVDPDSGDADDGAGQAPTSFSPSPEDVTIFESPVDGLSPFLCYKTKPTKGTLCTGTAAANAGGACASDGDCGGTAGACVKTAITKGLTAAVDDQVNGLGPRTLGLAKGTSLCTPAELDGKGQPLDDAAHLRGYQAKPAKGAPQHVPLVRFPIATALGTVILDTKKPDRLLAPSAKSRSGPVAPLGATAVDHFGCYTVKTHKKRCAMDAERKCKTSADCGVDGPCLVKFPKGLVVQAGDQFTTFAAPKALAVVKPTRLCFAADVDGSGIEKPGAMLLCYQTKPAAGAPKHAKIVGEIHTTNALVRERLDTVKEDELCLPAVVASGIS